MSVINTNQLDSCWCRIVPKNPIVFVYKYYNNYLSSVACPIFDRMTNIWFHETSHSTHTPPAMSLHFRPYSNYESRSSLISDDGCDAPWIKNSIRFYGHMSCIRFQWITNHSVMKGGDVTIIRTKSLLNNKQPFYTRLCRVFWYDCVFNCDLFTGILPKIYRVVIK